jgi:hypothetical protein
MDFGSAFQALTTTEKVARTVDSIVKNSRGHKRAVLRELQENISLLLLVRTGQYPAEKVVPRLERKHYLAAADGGFNFRQIKRPSLREKTIRKVPQFKKYVGWSTERLLENIYIKVKQLQTMVEMEGAKKNVNLEVRARYLLRLMILLLSHIKS